MGDLVSNGTVKEELVMKKKQKRRRFWTVCVYDFPRSRTRMAFIAVVLGLYNVVIVTPHHRSVR